jgi:hypothetical protein
MKTLSPAVLVHLDDVDVLLVGSEDRVKPVEDDHAGITEKRVVRADNPDMIADVETFEGHFAPSLSLWQKWFILYLADQKARKWPVVVFLRAGNETQTLI